MIISIILENFKIINNSMKKEKHEKCENHVKGKQATGYSRSL
jgi:hypothetical protein